MAGILQIRRNVRQVWLTQCAIMFLLLGCGTTTAPFDPATQLNVEQLKVQTLALIDKSGTKFTANQAAVAALTAKYDAAASAAAAIPKNEAVTAAWGIIRGPQSGSAVEYFNTWKQRGVMRPAIRVEKKTQIGRHFDYLICLEAAKQSGATCTNPLAASPGAPTIPADAPAEDPT
jgi:hypothetical protein